MFVPIVILFLKYLFACHECLLSQNVNIFESKQKPYFFFIVLFFFPPRKGKHYQRKRWFPLGWKADWERCVSRFRTRVLLSSAPLFKVGRLFE